MRISHESDYVYNITLKRYDVRKVSCYDCREKFLRAGLLDSVIAVKSRMASVLAARQSLRQSEAVSLPAFQKFSRRPRQKSMKNPKEKLSSSSCLEKHHTIYFFFSNGNILLSIYEREECYMNLKYKTLSIKKKICVIFLKIDTVFFR